MLLNYYVKYAVLISLQETFEIPVGIFLITHYHYPLTHQQLGKSNRKVNKTSQNILFIIYFLSEGN